MKKEISTSDLFGFVIFILVMNIIGAVVEFNYPYFMPNVFDRDWFDVAYDTIMGVLMFYFLWGKKTQ